MCFARASTSGSQILGISLRWFVHRRSQFEEFFEFSDSGLTAGRYFRLIALSVFLMCYSTVMAMFTLMVSLEQNGLRPWISWNYVHADWHRIDQFARVLVPQYAWSWLLAIWYIIPLSSVLFFAFFGFGHETRIEYINLFRWTFRTWTKSKPASVLPLE